MSDPIHSRTDSAAKRKYLEGYLLEQVASGDRYFKSKNIAKEIDLSAKEIGSLLFRLRQDSSKLAIEEWASTSAKTWYIEPR